jgi:hypothetical protein
LDSDGEPVEDEEMRRIREQEERKKNLEAEKKKMKQDNDMHKMAQMSIKNEIESLLQEF